ncbi:MAG: PQQ-binding-like beta-propeller repeat protein [Actinomycetota bacterium]
MNKGGGGLWVLGLLAILVIVGLFLALVFVGDGTDLADEGPVGEDAPPGGGDDGEVDPFGDPGSGLPGLGGDLQFRPDSVAVDADSVWVSDVNCGVVVKIDKASEEVVASIDLGSGSAGVAVADGSVWVGTRGDGRLVRLDPDELLVEDVVVVDGYALGLAATADEVWATDPISALVYRVDADTNEVLDTVEVGQNAHHIAIADGAAWITNTSDDTVSRVDLVTDVVVEVPVGFWPLHVEAGEGALWVTNNVDGTVSQLDPATGDELAAIEVGVAPHALAVVAGSVWVGSDGSGLWRIDPATGVSEPVPDTDFSSIDTAVDGTDIWVADSNGAAVVRFDAAAGAIGSIIELAEFGDCETFRSEAVTPPLVGAV